jgi:putative pre-16S rRNA nuclease
MRLLALDVGSRRIGVAVSDPTGTLATPVRAITGMRSPADAVSRIVECKDALERDDTPFAAIVVGLPAHLDGRPHERAAGIRALANAVGARVGLRVIFEDERLSSREAESRLAQRIRNWRKRKVLLDSAAAAVILQDYLDRRRAGEGREAID